MTGPEPGTDPTPMTQFFRRPGPPPAAPRRLFLDDDPARAEVFLAEYPDAVWVQTAAECVARLAEPWDEVHLDHDLGGERFVDHDREDCGMEVVRWLCLEPRPHLRATRFQIHTHNVRAATLMEVQMSLSGYAVTVRPFGAPAPSPPVFRRDGDRLTALARAVLRLLGRLRPSPEPSARPADPSPNPDTPA